MNMTRTNTDEHGRTQTNRKTGPVMLCSGKRLEEVEPLEVTSHWVRTRRGDGFAVAFVGDGGELQSMLPDFDEDEAVLHGTLYESRKAARAYIERWRAQGLDVVYREQLEVLPFAAA